MPVLLHGDAAFPGQGVVAETLNLQSLEGYSTGGTIHIIPNNQIGFTTDPQEGALDPLRRRHGEGLQRADHPRQRRRRRGLHRRGRLAMAYRERWGRDVVIDLIGYRRYGHNETDEPAYTQPLMAAKIKEHPPVCEIYADELIGEGVVTQDELRRHRHEAAGQRLDARRSREDEAGELRGPSRPRTTDRRARPQRKSPRSRPPSPQDAAQAERGAAPGAGQLHDPPQAAQARCERRRTAMTEGGIEFGHAEALAFASLLTEGVHIRLTGQDTERGTFSHRHLVLHDDERGHVGSAATRRSRTSTRRRRRSSSTTARSRRPPASASSTATRPHSPDSLVLWEAQFGDFANSAPR